MTDDPIITEQDLHAYVDGELDVATLAEVEAWLVGHPDDAVKVHGYRLQKIRLHEIYDDALEAPVPAEVHAALSSSRVGRWVPTWQKMAAGLVLLAVGGMAGWGVGGLPISSQAVETTFVRSALNAHVVYAHDTARPVEVSANQPTQLMSWLSGRVGHPLRTPDIQGAGFKLIGGRLVADQDLPAALFMYEDIRDRRVTLYVRTAQPGAKTAFRFIAEHGMVAFYWTDGPLAYVLTGEMPRGDLLDLARMVQKDLDT
jgi:anti-sigma factor RsiW